MDDVISVLADARRYKAAGLSVIPVKADGSKTPAHAGWRAYSATVADDAQVDQWFADNIYGIGVVPGPASGNLVVLDFECKHGRPAYAEWTEKLPPELSQYLLRCPVVRTPSGGRHVWVRLPESQHGARLARYKNGDTKAEIRGEGHQVLAPGCPLSCHKSGEPYQFENYGWIAPHWMPGQPEVDPVIPMEVWQGFLQTATEINDWSAPDFPSVGPERAVGPASEDAPGTDFNRRGTWEETGLFDHGWKWVRRASGDRGLLCRPGKSEGVSASAGMVTSVKNGWPLFYPWSTSVADFVPEKPYTRFAVYAILKHGGDFKEAARSLSQSGYGKSMPDVKVSLSSVLGNFDRPPPPPGETEEARIFRWMSELKFRPENDKWLWHGYLSRGGITLLSALWKAGKSTMLSYLVRGFDGRTTEFCGREIVPSRVLYVSEEHEELWAERRDSLNIGDHVGMVSRPFKGRPSPGEWVAFIGNLIAAVEKHRFDVVVVDTLSKLWPVREENDAGQVEEALMPLWQLTNTGVGLMLVHHTRKSEGTQFTSARGSGGLSAFCETLMEFRREDDKDTKNFNRILTAQGRYRETPVKWKIELTTAGYVSHGDPDDIASTADLGPTWQQVLGNIMPLKQPGLTIDELMEKLISVRGKGVRRQDLLAEIGEKFMGGEYMRHGDGTKANPFLYCRA